MEIKENTNYLGSITFPDYPQDVIDIVINYNKNDGITFEFADTKSSKLVYRIITGSFSNKIDFTLINCFQKSFGNNCYKYTVDLLIVNRKFQTQESLAFNRFKFISNDLSNWLNKPFWEGVTHKSLSINENQYKKNILFEKSILFSISNGIDSQYSNHIVNYSGYSYLELSCIDKTKGLSIVSVFSFFEKLFKLLTLISGNNFSIDFITCYTDSPIEKEQELLSYNNYYPVYRKIKEIKSHFWLGELFFKYQEIEEYIDLIINTWNAKEEYHHIIDLNLTHLINPYGSRNTHFLNSYACFEGIDKHIRKDNSKMRPIEYHKNLFLLFYPDHFELFKKTSIDTRNYLAHGKKGSEYVFNDFELLYASKAFIMISRFLILKEYGIPEQLLVKKLEISAKSFIGLMIQNAYYDENLIDIPII